MVCLGFGKLGGEVWVPRSKGCRVFLLQMFFPCICHAEGP